MNDILKTGGNIAAIAGLLLCAISGAARAMGNFHLLGYEAMTLFNVGIGIMVAACLFKLETLLRR